jgi:hypothetical protein
MAIALIYMRLEKGRSAVAAPPVMSPANPYIPVVGEPVQQDIGFAKQNVEKIEE